MIGNLLYSMHRSLIFVSMQTTNVFNHIHCNILTCQKFPTTHDSHSRESSFKLDNVVYSICTFPVNDVTITPTTGAYIHGQIYMALSHPARGPLCSTIFYLVFTYNYWQENIAMSQEPRAPHNVHSALSIWFFFSH